MHKIYLTLFVLSLVTLSSVLLAQKGFIDVPIPSSESAILAQFSLAPPNYYTGVQSLSVPM